MRRGARDGVLEPEGTDGTGAGNDNGNGSGSGNGSSSGGNADDGTDIVRARVAATSPPSKTPVALGKLDTLGFAVYRRARDGGLFYNKPGGGAGKKRERTDVRGNQLWTGADGTRWRGKRRLDGPEGEDRGEGRATALSNAGQIF